MIPVNSIVSVEDVISRIKFDLRLSDTTEHDLGFEILIREGLGSLNCLTQLEKKQCNLEVNDCNVALPDDLVNFIALRPKTWVSTDDATSKPLCGNFIYANTQFLNNCGCSLVGLSNFSESFQLNKGYIHFNDDNSAISEVTIAYEGLWKDKEGKRVIFERFERALTAYACWKFTRSWNEKYPQHITESYHQEWVLQKDYLKGQDVARDFQNNRREISELMRAWIVSAAVNY